MCAFVVVSKLLLLKEDLHACARLWWFQNYMYFGFGVEFICFAFKNRFITNEKDDACMRELACNALCINFVRMLCACTSASA